MTATMVSSVVTAQSVQKDGRVWVTEQHVDSLGATYTVTYLAHDTSEIAAHLAADAISLLAAAASAEVATNVNGVLTYGSVFVPTLNYSTIAANANALTAIWLTLTQTQAIMLGDYLNNVPLSGLTSTFGWSAAQAAQLQTQYFVPYAALAASIRTAAGGI